MLVYTIKESKQRTCQTDHKNGLPVRCGSDA
jgi:hypothetical protein